MFHLILHLLLATGQCLDTTDDLGGLQELQGSLAQCKWTLGTNFVWDSWLMISGRSLKDVVDMIGWPMQLGPPVSKATTATRSVALFKDVTHYIDM